MTDSALPFAPVAGGFLLRRRLTPKGGRDAVACGGRLFDGTGVVKARKRAACEDDVAVAALVRADRAAQ